MKTLSLTAFTRLLLGLLVALSIALRSAAQEDAIDDGGLFGFLRSEKAEKYDLDPAAPDELLGVVVNEQDQGVAGATVYLRPEGNWNDAQLRETTTDDRGQFIFRRLEVGRYALMAFKDAAASRTERRKWFTAEFEPDLSREPIVLALKPARQLRVRVIEQATGEPLPGADLKIGWPDVPPNRKTDENGEAIFAGLYPHEFEITATATGFAKQERHIGLKGDAAGLMTIALEPGAVLFGVVRDDKTGEPVPYPRTHLRDPIDRGMFFDFTRGGADGSFRFNHVRPGISIIVDLDPDGYVGSQVTIPPLHAGEVREFNPTDQKLPPGGSVKGLVTDESDKPIAGAKVSVAYESNQVTYTDSEGRFRLDGIHHRRNRLIAKAPKRAGREVRFTQGTLDEPGEVTVVLKPGAKIRGRVINEAGEPVAGATVEFPTYSHGSAGESVKVGADGMFEFDTVPEDTDFRVYARGYSDFSRQKLPLNEDRVIDIVLAPEGVIKGVALDDETGEPLTSFNVRMTFSPDGKPGDPSGGISTDWDSPGRRYDSNEGHFDIDDLVVGQPMIVTVEAEGYRPATIRRVEASRPDAEDRAEFRLKSIDADKLTTVAGVIVDDRGEPVASAEVRLYATVDGTDERGEPINWRSLRGELEVNDRVLQAKRAATDEDGKFRFEGIYSDCVIEIAYWRNGVAQGRLQGIEKMSVEERQTLKIETEASARLTVTLHPEAFSAIGSVSLRSDTSYNDPNRVDLQDYAADADGKWVIDDVPAGEYHLTVSQREPVDDTGRGWRFKPVHQQPLTIKAGEEKTLQIDKPEML